MRIESIPDAPAESSFCDSHSAIILPTLLEQNIKNSLKTLKKMELGIDYSQAMINIANHISLQQVDRLI